MRTGFSAAVGDIVIVQDADLEYDPQEYAKIIAPITEGQADVTFSSRFAGSESHRVLFFWHYLGNKFLTLLSNCTTGLNLTDMESCYKAFRREIIHGIHLEEDRFGFEPEVTAKLALVGCRIYEVGVSYHGRTYAEGKKIGWRDGMRAVWCILKYGLLRRWVATPASPKPAVGPEPGGRACLALAAALALLLACYLVQMVSPLRLNTDAVVYLLMAESAAEGHGFLYQGQPTRYPSGYPALLAGLDRMGLASAAAFVALNCLFLAGGVAAAYVLLRRSFGLGPAPAIAICCLTLLSYLLIKHTPLPVSDVPYFGLSILSLLALAVAWTGTAMRRWGMLALGVMLVMASIEVRVIGIALLPPVAWAALSRPTRPRFPFLQVLRRKPALASAGLVLLLAALALGAVAVSRTAYFREAQVVYTKAGVTGNIREILDQRVREWGELACNVPRSKLPAALWPALAAAGAVSLGLVAASLWRRRNNFGPVEVYLVSYSAILFAWPWFDARFWLPLIPLLMGMVAAEWRGILSLPAARPALAAYLGGYGLLGLVALGYSSRLSLAGPRFADLYGDGTPPFQAAYRAALSGVKPAESGQDINAEVYHLLRRYERSARVPSADGLAQPRGKSSDRMDPLRGGLACGPAGTGSGPWPCRWASFLCLRCAHTPFAKEPGRRQATQSNRNARPSMPLCLAAAACKEASRRGGPPMETPTSPPSRSARLPAASLRCCPG